MTALPTAHHYIDAIMADPRTPQDMPFDGKRLIRGGFVPLLVV